LSDKKQSISAGGPELCQVCGAFKGPAAVCPSCSDPRPAASPLSCGQDLMNYPSSVIKDSGEREEFDTGAVRDAAKGKGRIDLLPMRTFEAMLPSRPSEGTLVAAWLCLIQWFVNRDYSTLLWACTHAMTSLEVAERRNGADKDFPVGPDSDPSRYGWVCATQAISQIYEDGCIKYGERNWEKGIPLTNFFGSAWRHITKTLACCTDERHHAMAVWNILCIHDTVLRMREGILPESLDDLPPIDSGGSPPLDVGDNDWEDDGVNADAGGPAPEELPGLPL